jgi:hypothetical protein
MGGLVTLFVGTRGRETTALLAVLAELMVDEPELQGRCRKEVAERKDALPKWVSALPGLQFRRAVRATHVLGDEDELLIGMQLMGKYDMTCIVHINHNMASEIDDADFMPDSIDEVVTSAVERNTDADVSVADMTLADAGAWIRHGLDQTLFPRKSDSWPDCLPLVRWLSARLPQGGLKYQSPEWDWAPLLKLVRRFFASRQGAPFDCFCSEELLLELIDSGTGDPLRWSAARVARLLDGVPFYSEHIPLENVLEVPELLRAFIPFAHAESGIRDQLTLDALAIIDEMSPAYKKEVLDKAEYWS